MYFNSVGANSSLQNPYLYACVENSFNLRCSIKPNRDKNELILLCYWLSEYQRKSEGPSRGLLRRVSEVF